MKKEERKKRRVTEEFRNDRRPVASLTDDALLRSRLQAQKDGTAVMDSKWLEIVGRCHRATSFCPSSSFLLSLALYFLSLLAICIFFHLSLEIRGTRCTPSRTDRRAWNFTRFSSIFLCVWTFARTEETAIHSKSRSFGSQTIFIEYIRRTIQCRTDLKLLSFQNDWFVNYT